MPSIKKDESQKDFISRCIPTVMHEGTTKDPAQAAAICHSKWRQHLKASALDWANESAGKIAKEEDSDD